MIRDPIPALQPVLKSFITSLEMSPTVEIDGVVGRSVGWRPHLLESKNRAWYIHARVPESSFWLDVVRRAKSVKSKLRIGVAATEQLFSDEEFLQACHELEASIIIFEERGETYVARQYFHTVDDFICAAQLKLSHQGAGALLDRALSRALKEKKKARKGVLLELTVAVLLSQVEGFEVTDIGISNRSQQMDVLVHNRNVGGALGASPVVLAEAKNWKDPVGTTEYFAFVRKLETRHRRAKLGYLITTGTFTTGVKLERGRDSTKDTLVVLIDGKTLPTIWREQKTITQRIERLTLTATVGD